MVQIDFVDAANVDSAAPISAKYRSKKSKTAVVEGVCDLTLEQSGDSVAETSKIPPNFDAEFDRIDAVFGDLIDLIPLEHFGFDQETKEAIRDRKHSVQNDRMSKKNSNIKRSSKHKLSRADDDQLQTVSQVLHWLAEKEGAGKRQAGGTGVVKRKTTDKPSSSSIWTSREFLLEKLHGKLTEFKENRKATAVDYREKQKIKRRISKLKSKQRAKQEKRDRALGAKGASVEIAGSAKEAVKRKAADDEASLKKAKPAKKSKLELLREKTNASLNKIPNAAAEAKSTAEKKKPAEKNAQNRPNSSKLPDDQKILNSEGKVVYSKFDFVVSGAQKNGASAKKSKSKLAGKDFQTLLKKVGKQKEKLDQLRLTDPEKAAEFEKKLAWQAALDRAEGFKVKDNPDLLKRSIASKQKRRQHTFKKWEERKKSTQALRQKKDDKRSRNIAKRKTQKKEKGIERAKKKGRYVPGF